jgi:hypothetical protein
VATLAGNNLHLVFNRPPTGIAWAAFHFSEIVAIPGWESARRFRLEPNVQPPTPIPFPFMSLYELSGDPNVAVAEMSRTKYDLPEWFERAQQESCFAGWNCIQIGEQVDAAPGGMSRERARRRA